VDAGRVCRGRIARDGPKTVRVRRRVRGRGWRLGREWGLQRGGRWGAARRGPNCQESMFEFFSYETLATLIERKPTTRAEKL